MRLLRLDDHEQLSLTTHDTDSIPPYAILSHTWGTDDEELTFQDVMNHRYQEKAGFAKVRFCGEQARKNGYQYFWVDSCCIDKTNSAELSESIISMFRWYKRASKCYVYLQDVSARKRDNSGQLEGIWEAAFQSSRWFKRGWTLQELLAPNDVIFFSRDWNQLGDKVSLEAMISRTTEIPVSALRGAPLSEFPPNERLRWAAKRQTRRKEDKAYCLQGIFNVFLSPMYGEEEYAFHRLEEAIGRRWSQLDPDLIAVCSSNSDTQNVAVQMAFPTTSDRSSGLKQRRDELMKSLTFDQMDSRRSTIKDAQRKTCEWLLQHPTFVAWSDPNKPPQERDIFWINGKPGAGKSTLLKFIQAHVKKRRKPQTEILVSFFFNARGEELEKTTVGMYRSLLFQLLTQAADLQSILDDSEAALTDSLPYWTLETLETLFTAAVADLGKRRLTCFIDALDECDERQVRDMVSLFEDLGDSAIEGETQLRICFASRHYPEIRVKKGLSMVLEKEDGHGDDLRVFIRRQLDAGDGEADDLIRSRLLEKSNGVFMWVVLVIDILNIEYQRGRMWAVERRLEEIPVELSDLFRDILRRDSIHMDDLLLCLQWILFAKRPLKLEEFYFAMTTGLDEARPGPWDPGSVKNQDMLRFVIASSKGLAEATKSEEPTVQFIHESVRDFLLKDGGLCDLWPQLSGKLASVSHDRLKQCCQKYMTVDLSGDVPSRRTLPKASSSEGAKLREEVNARFPFLDYASQHVLYHANQAARDLSQKAFLEYFALDVWVRVTNIFQRYHNHRHNSNATLLYISAENNLTRLIGRPTLRALWTRVEGERYGFPFLAAFANGHRESLAVLLDKDVSFSLDVITKEPGFGRASEVRSGEDALIWAARTQNWILLEYILRSTRELDVFTVTQRPPSGRDALSFAASHGQDRIVELLLDMGADVNGTQKKNELSPLSWAVECERTATTLVLLARGAIFEPINRSMCSEIMEAAFSSGFETVVEMLLKEGVDPPQNALEDASRKGWTRMVELLLDFIEPSGAALEIALREGQTRIVETLLDLGLKPSGGALESACREGHEQIVEMLIKASAGPDRDERPFSRELHYAALRGYEKISSMLIDAGADVNDFYYPSLPAASSGGDAGTVRMLINAGADVDFGHPLSTAAISGHEMIVQMLIDAGAELNCSPHNPLREALVCGHENIAQMLRDAGAVE